MIAVWVWHRYCSQCLETPWKRKNFEVISQLIKPQSCYIFFYDAAQELIFSTLLSRKSQKLILCWHIVTSNHKRDQVHWTSMIISWSIITCCFLVLMEQGPNWNLLYKCHRYWRSEWKPQTNHSCCIKWQCNCFYYIFFLYNLVWEY